MRALKQLRKPVLALVACLLFVTGAAEVQAQGTLQPYRSFAVDSTGRSIPIPDPYVLERAIDGIALGIGDFASPGDIFVNRENDHLYIVDTGNSRIVELDDRWQLVREFGSELKLKAPAGIYRDPADGSLWIADTGNVRILQVSNEVRLLKEYGPPETVVLAEIRSAGPTKVLTDKRGYIYYLEGSGAGMVVLDQENRFRGFFGTNRLSFSALWLWARYLATEAQRVRLLLSKPMAHTDMYMGPDGFIYTVSPIGVSQVPRLWSGHWQRTGSEGGPSESAIQKLSPVGVNVFVEKSLERKLYRSQTFGERRRSWEPPFRHVAVTVDDGGIVTALDQSAPRIYQFDQDRNTLMAFGKSGTGPADFGLPVEIDVDSRGFLYVVDSSRHVIKVLRPTSFARLVHQASALQFDGRYEEAAAAWREVLGLASNYELAHSGVGAAYYHQGRWLDAMQEYALGRDQLGYSLAFYEYRQDLLRSNMSWLVSGIFLLLIGVLVWPSIARRESRDRARSTRRRRDAAELHPALGILLHPNETFERLATGSSLWPVVILLGLAGLARVLSLALIAFHMRATPSVGSVLDWVRLYRPVAASLLPELRWEDANLFVEMLRIVLPWSLWTAANYGVSALFEGEGTFRGVARTTAYCLVPYIVFAVPVALLSHGMTANERGLYETLWSLVYYWVLILLVLQLRTVHNYSIRRTVSVGLVSVFGVVVLGGGIVTLGILSGELIGFVGDVLYDIVRTVY